MFHAALNILRDSQLAEDAVHESFIRLTKNLHKIDEDNHSKTYKFLIVICRNVSLDIIKRKSSLNLSELHENIVDDSKDMDEIIINDETFNRVLKGIKTLIPEYQSVILLKYSHHLTNDEIAKFLEVSTDLVRKRIERAKKQLSNLLSKEGLM